MNCHGKHIAQTHSTALMNSNAFEADHVPGRLPYGAEQSPTVAFEFGGLGCGRVGKTDPRTVLVAVAGRPRLRPSARGTDGRAPRVRMLRDHSKRTGNCTPSAGTRWRYCQPWSGPFGRRDPSCGAGGHRGAPGLAESSRADYAASGGGD